jgi:hypothetical protein
MSSYSRREQTGSLKPGAAIQAGREVGHVIIRVCGGKSLFAI